VGQNIIEDDGSRFASEPDPVQRPSVSALGLPSHSQQVADYVWLADSSPLALTDDMHAPLAARKP
jgi:hypothetical protein